MIILVNRCYYVLNLKHRQLGLWYMDGLLTITYLFHWNVKFVKLHLFYVYAVVKL